MTLKDMVWRFKGRVIRRVLRLTGGDVQAAADLLQVDRTALYVTARRCGIEIAKVRRKRTSQPGLQISAGVAQARRDWLAKDESK